MAGPRNPDLSKELHDYIYNQWMYFGLNAYQISNQINADTELMSKFGKTSSDGVRYHIVKIRQELENTLSEDAMDTYIGEFMRGMEGYDQDIQSLDTLISHEKGNSLDQADKDTLIKLYRLRHEIKTDKFKMLQDSALPLQVKKLKRERDKYRPKVMPKKEELEDNSQRSSE